MRASDADREHVVAILRDQVGTGRLTLEEFSERSATAYQSSTISELDALTRDLPRPAPAPVLAPTLAVQSGLLPVLLVLAVALLVGGTFLALASLDSGDSMTQMMNHMMGR
jgi:hypothetical protein